MSVSLTRGVTDVGRVVEHYAFERPVRAACGHTSGMARKKGLVRFLASRSAQDWFTTSGWVASARQASDLN